MRKRQLDEKMEDNRRRQHESIESREELLRELEQVQQLTAREKAEEERKRREREEEMQAQVWYTCYFSYFKDMGSIFSKKREGEGRRLLRSLSSLLRTRELFSYHAPPWQLLLLIRAYFFTFCRVFIKFTDNISQGKGQRTRTTWKGGDGKRKVATKDEF